MWCVHVGKGRQWWVCGNEGAWSSGGLSYGHAWERCAGTVAGVCESADRIASLIALGTAA